MKIGLNLKIGDKKIEGDIEVEPGDIIKEIMKGDGKVVGGILNQVSKNLGIFNTDDEEKKKEVKDEFLD